ncbi:hypothetical protein OK349_04305 [Sphingomonas sp. BT-65]|uniref:hypothetical protein n=1 Tax=Sphingomonas sp. BT-65 TaxID=2989821 RepID=UPI0022357514|nr:hypothetical protein [Sphingomonas sp. BT-65]MCW4460917.1 hypothetical protein [Sphingomonas sp. BT-65]
MRMLAALLPLALISSPMAASPQRMSGAFSERQVYFNDGAPPTLKIDMEIKVDKDTLTYRGVNTMDPANPIITEFSGKFDGKVRPYVGRHFDHLAIHKLHHDEFLVEKYQDGQVVIGEFWRYAADTDEWIRHGVVAKMPGGKTRTYVEYYRRQK